MEINKIIHGNCLDVMKTLPDNCIDAIVTDPPYGLSFMGKKWDYDVPSQEIREECLRILKPGGYLLAFAGTRTQHRMAVRIEDAGFEIRDMIAWVYGSGFPKSLNIGKAVDKLLGNEREVTGDNPNFRENSGKNNFTKEGTFATTEGMKVSTKGTSEWEGRGTALKPALEPITVARKPLGEKTVAENCLKWGVGGINIDGCRVGYTDGTTEEQIRRKYTGSNEGNGSVTNNFGVKDIKMTSESTLTGRFPANFIHDGSDEVVGLFPGEGDKSASRFFYVAKASKGERNKGCEGLPLGEPPASARSTPAEGRSSALGEARANNHPTVKPIALMKYLIKMVTKEGGIVFDPFAGSGTTLLAAKKNGYQYLGTEMTEEYIPIIEARLNSI